VATLATGLISRPRLARTLAGALDTGSVMLVAGPGYGKTMALEEALAYENRRSVWIACGESGGESGRLLMGVVEGLRTAVPGLADVVGDRLATGLEPVDVSSATAALVPELERLLVEPLVIVLDDAEELEGSTEALALVDQLLAVRAAPLSVAVATRRPLRLRLAKLRAAGRLTEIGPVALGFTAGECEELLTLRHGRPVSHDEVEAVVAACEGWPMAVALTSLAGPGDTPIETIPREGLFDYLAEEVLDRLDPAMRLGVLASSIPDTLTPELARDLGLPPDFIGQAERSGLFLRAHAGARSYHPLFRAFLRQRLPELMTEPELKALHGRAAVSLARAGRFVEAIENWLAAGQPEAALAALSSEGAGLVRTSPGTVAGWLSQLDPAVGREPDYLFLEAQLLWGAGEHERAQEPLAEAVSGYRAAGRQDREWIARVFLADTLIWCGDFELASELSEGWREATDPVATIAATAVRWYEAMALAALGRKQESEALMVRLRRDEETAAQFIFIDVTVYAGTEPAAGHAKEALERLRLAIAALELHDPQGRLPYALGMLVHVLHDLGEFAQVLEVLDRCEREAERLGVGFVVRDCQLQRAAQLARQGDLSRAEFELARAGRRQGTGWRGVHEAEAEAEVALLRGDGPAAVAAAQVALDRVAPGPLAWRVFAVVAMAQVLTQAGAPEIARDAIATTLVALDERFPAERGRVHRARLLASRACLEYEAGEGDAACASMRDCWAEAGPQADQIVRAHWPALKPVLWHALAEGAIAPDAVLPAVQEAFPSGDALVAMVEHPDPTVRRAALLTALPAGHPAVLAQLAEFEKDRDEQVAAAATAIRQRVASRPPPLRYEVLGGFRVHRAGWELDEAAWKRPMAARVVRFLLTQGTGRVPEDALFDAFWSDRSADAARQHLAQAVSRARRVLDLPGTDHSVIEAKERTYRLCLRERDSVDAAEFEVAAAAALAHRGPRRRAALEAAATLWTGDPLPEERYSPWSFAWRDRLVHTYAHVLSALVEACDAAADHNAAIQAATRWLEIDPLNERAHQQLMVSYSRTGRKSQALRQFLECRRALVSELGVEPSAATSVLQAQILAGDPV
jgi:ATP/maltotriose-dependent transcriptional regulator MalT/DNA-binding SARP family transcriptional activator